VTLTLVMQAPDPDSPLAGELVLILMAAAALAFPVSIALLGMYRRRVVRGMRTRALPGSAEPATASGATVPQRAPPTPIQLLQLDSASVVAGGPAGLVFSRTAGAPWRAAMVYGLAGSCFAGVMASAYVEAADAGFRLMAWLHTAWTFAWPVVLTVIFVAGPGSRLRTASAYFAGLLFLDAVALARSPNVAAGDVVAQWLALNGPPSLLLAAVLARPIRAVGPLVLTFLAVALTGAACAIALTAGQSDVQRVIAEVGAALHLNAPVVFVGIIAAGFAALAPLGWLAARWLAHRYARKRVSDQSVTVDAVWLLFGLIQSIVLVAQGRPARIGWGLLAFVVYKVVVTIGFAAPSQRDAAGAPRLLLLRAFSPGPLSERLFDAVTLHWRYAGSVQLIAGPDLATTTIEPHEFLDFLRGRLARRFIDGPETMDRRFAEVDLAPDHDGRFRVNEFFCYDDTWRAVLRRLATTSDVAVMDLRGFSRQHAGLAFEIQALIHTVELARILILVDASTDQAHLAEIAEDAWRTLPADSPNRASASPALRLFPAAGAHRAPLPLLRALAAAARPATAAA